jgi:hypothetical protein
MRRKVLYLDRVLLRWKESRNKLLVFFMMYLHFLGLEGILGGSLVTMV